MKGKMRYGDSDNNNEEGDEDGVRTGALGTCFDIIPLLSCFVSKQSKWRQSGGIKEVMDEGLMGQGDESLAQHVQVLYRVAICYLSLASQ